MGFDENVLTERIRPDNAWWIEKTIPFYNELSKRRYYDGFFDLVNQALPHGALVLVGPRRIGKTAMMYQAIQELIDSGIPANKIFYFSLDIPIYTNLYLEDLFKRGLSINEVYPGGCYVFFDEIQYLKDWEVQ